jgi:4-amino-4-deoxy-L-arabinose transferase-like glycosyltransferase
MEPTSRLKRVMPELAIFAVALALRLALFLAVGAWDPDRLEQRIFVGDAPEYHQIATNLIEHGVYSSRREPPLDPNTFRVPLYSGYLALIYRVVGPLPHLAILAQLAFSALTCVVACRIGTILFDRSTGIVAGWILAIDYSSILFSNRLYADTLFMLLVAAALLALSRFLVGDGTRPLIVAGLCLGLATLCRPVSLYFVVALAPVVWLRLRGRPRLALARWGLLVAVYLLTLSPWMLRNLAASGRPYVTSMQRDVAEWYLPSTAGAEAAARHRDRPPPAEPLSWARAGNDARAFTRGFVRFFAILGSGEIPLILGIPYGRHDYVALREASLGEWVAATWNNRSSPLERGVVFAIAAYLAVLYLAAARGLWRSLRLRRWLESSLLLATIAYFMVATGPIAREIRYRLPALPAIVLFAAMGIAPSSAPRTSALKTC